MKKTVTTLVLTAALGMFAAHSAKADGDIYDISPCDANGVDLAAGSTWSTASAPLGSGETVYFKVRLVAKQNAGSAALSRWRLDYDGLINEEIAKSLYPMRMGIYVSGVKTYATLVSAIAEKNYTTALVFSYTTQPGDFAMPVRLAMADGPAGDSISNGEYVFDPLAANWKVRCEYVETSGSTSTTNTIGATWQFVSPGSDRMNWGFSDKGSAPNYDYSLEQCGIYVKTVGFSNDAETETYWRTIHENSTITGSGVSPRLSITAASSEARTFYVWSDNEAAVRVKTDNTVTMQVDAGGTMATYHVGKVRFEGGSAADVSFLVEAMPGAEGATANLILSAYSNFNYSATSGQQLPDYVTVPVLVSKALPASIIVECADATVAADHDYLTSKTSLSVYLSQAATNDVAVTLKTTFEDDASKTNWYDYVRFSTSANTLSTLPSTDEVSFTIPAGSTEKKIIYVYTLRGDSHTTGDGHQVKFSGYVSDAEKAAAGIEDSQDAGLWISAAKPVITTPDSTSTYEVTAGEFLEINVAVEDTYADMTDTNTGYTVRIKTGSTAGWMTLPDRYKASGEDGELVGLTNNLPPTIEYPTSGEQTSQIQVISPISGKRSEIVQFTVNVAPAKTTSAISLDEDPDNYVEGDVVKFRMALSAQNDTSKPIYAFLLCNEDVDLSMFGGTAAKAILTNADVAVSSSAGRQISTVGTYVDSSFTVLDGLSADDGGQNYTFSVVLCSSKNYNPTNRLAGYETTEMLNITVYNKEPTFNTVYLNGFEAETDGWTFANKYPKSQKQRIQPDVSDVSYDLKHGFTYKWTLSRNGQTTLNGTVAHDTEGTVTNVVSVTNGNSIATLIPDGANINDFPLVYDFPRSGTWTVKFQIKDKDMTSYAAETYSITFDVLDNPAVTITPESSYEETATSASFDVSLGGYFDSDDDIVVKLTVTPPEGANPGTLILDSAYKTVPDGYPALSNNEYYVSFDSADAISIGIDMMDGTVRSSSKGFVVKAEVVSTGVSPDGKTWAEYYLPGSAKIFIDNVAPVFGYVTPENTNAWQVAGGAATSYPIMWTIRSDVDDDFTNAWTTGEGPGIKVSFVGCENAETFYVTLTNEWSGKFTPNFGAVQGDQNVVLTIEDKDGGIQTWTYMYRLTPSKTIVTIPNGPTGIGNSSLSQKYVAAKGRGEGHIFPDGPTFSTAKVYALSWFASGISEIPVYGYGYAAGAVDNGYLDDGNDQAISSTGGVAVKPGTVDVVDGYYKYNSIYDSYLYAWIIAKPSSDAAAVEWEFTIAPHWPLKEPVPSYARLPSAMTEDNNYIPVKVEAVFAREWLVEDNLGDINQDGIPDVFVSQFNLLGASDDGSTAIGDLVDLSGNNPDEDQLPGIYADVSNSYAPIGNPLTTLLEIRGFGDGLNATDVTTPGIRFSTAETNAYKAAFAAENGREWAAEDGFDLGFWSPEPGSEKYPRMDPTLADTDVDQFPDGWEYYFWYQARVWVPGGADKPLGKPRDGQHFVFERFDPLNINIGTEIPADEVLARFDPCTPYDPEKYTGPKHLKFDFDHDGLSDLEELLIGTNPCHWDTDGDRICDGWEVMMCIDPLAGSKDGNPDHDFMAYHSVRNDPCWIDPNEAITDPTAEGVRIYALPGLQLGIDYDMQFDPGTMEIKYVMLKTMDVQAYSFTPKYKNGDRLVYGLLDERPRPGDPIPAGWIWGYCMVDYVRSELITMHAGDELLMGLDYILVHDQVHDAFGFDPRTGWSNVGGYVSNRWNPNSNPENVNVFDTTGEAVDTRPYNTYDEYLVMQYRTDYEIDYSPMTDADDPVDPTAENIWGLLASKTTNPNYVAYQAASADDASTSTNATDTASSTNATAAASIAQQFAELSQQAGLAPVLTHGADTDQDGVPDGWELYMYRNPNAAPISDDEDGLGQPLALDFDGDELTWADEYAGVDACEVYKDCESIYRHHPGIAKGWWNKFFPTNPGTMKRFSDSLALLIFAGRGNADGADTDLDGVPDSIEGGVWGVVFANADNQWAAELGFIYGSPEDDGLTVCFRGGGMNPCTIDTDLDGIPDGWEMQHAGVPVSLPDLAIVAPRGGDVEDIELDNATFIADGIYTGVSLSNGVYIAGGMDATWKGDAVFDDFEDPEFCLSYDSLLGTRRDVDFDHDGLQNYQEYLVQSIRHFRYDDITTPLMGRQFEEGEYDPASKRVVSPHSQSFGDSEGETDGTGTGFPVFDASDPGTTAANAAEAWNGRSFVYYETVTTGVREVVRVVDPYTGEVETNKIYYTAQKKRFTTGAALAAKHVAAGGSALQYAWNEDGWRGLGYFAAPRRSWDRAVASNKIGNPIYMWPITGSMVAVAASVGGYASTDPRLADTDGDGMDDFYELYHGLNPILGTSPANAAETSWIGLKSGDIVSAQYWMSNYPFDSRSTFNAWYNEWIYPTYSGLLGREATPPGDAVGMPLQAPQAWDPVLYPWAAGSPRADADGDGIVNDEERIIANVADPVGRHTDPTPLWFTERTTPASYVAQYYMLPSGVFSMPWAPSPNDDFQEASLRTETDSTRDLYISGAYTYSFEENEGYDTDGDMTPDSGEVVSKVKPASDPLRFDDPDRRQALYLPGENAYAVSRDIQIRPIDSEDFLKQFTVECWILPERTDVAQTVVERTVAYEGDSIGTAAYALRANFRIGIDAQGVVYGMFDNNDSIESGLNSPNSCQFVKGKEVTAGKWTHVALSFDGKVLSLYIDGYPVKRAPTGLTPANGVVQIMQNSGNTAAFTAYKYRATPCALLIGARPKAKNLYALYPYFINELGMHMESFDNVQEYFKGYVDEVRVWDGARTSQQILANYRKAMGYADAAANRSEVFEVYAQAGTRNNNDGNLTLPPELVLNYGFSTLPGAVNAADVAKVPGGFYAKVLDAAMSDYASNPDIDTTGLYDNLLELKGQPGGWVAGDLLVGWWNDSLLKSTVYDDYHVVPWIRNTVSHLPLMDGSSPDSFVYGDYFGAVYTPASEHGLAKYTFPNSAVPYPTTVRNLDAYYRLAQAARRVEQLGGVYSNALVECQFQVRNNFVGTADLIPLGGAYAKTCPKLWDGDVADPWEQTLSDANGDGIPDWWEEYARYNYAPDVDPAMAVGWDTLVDYHGTSMKAGLAYVIDIYRGLQPDGSIDPAYAVNTDSDGDSIPDWWENIFGIASQGADDDADNDGLSNYAEYTASFGPYPYGLTNGWHFLSPVDAYSTSLEQKVTDYFLRAPKAFDDAARHIHAGEYYGEIFTDHDMMEAWWEKTYAPSYASSYAYDAGRDADGDGWDNWSEVRSATWCGTLLADLVTKYLSDQVSLKNYPQPAIGIRFTYPEGNVQDISGRSVVVRTMTSGRARTDATFTIVAPQAADVGTASHTVGAFIDVETPIRSYLQPGSIVPTSCYVYGVHLSKDGVYYWGISETLLENFGWGSTAGTWIGERTLSRTDGSSELCWYCTGTYDQYVTDVRAYGRANVILDNPGLDFDLIGKALSRDDGRMGDFKIMSAQTEAQSVFGTVNFLTGEFTLDPAPLEDAGLAPAGMLVKIEYTYSVSTEWPQTLWFNNPSSGRVRQGLNTIEAWIDLDGNGGYTAGEPYGIVRNVNIGWHRTAETVIELRDTSTIIPHYLLSDGSSDRTVVQGVAGGVVASPSAGGGEGEGQEGGQGGLTTKIVVRRIGINGESLYGHKTVPNRTLVSKTYVIGDRAYLTEADVLSDDKFDLDWKWLVNDAVKLGLAASDIKTAEYEISQVATLAGGTVTNISLATFSNAFNSQRPVPVARAPIASAPVYSAAPTFSWTCADDTMTAFRLQISTSTNQSDVVYDSGIQHLPGRDYLAPSTFAHSFTPPFYVNDPVATNGAFVVADATNYFWRVTEYNAKYSATDAKAWSAWTSFQMDVRNENRYPKLSTGYGKCGAVVRYFGPNTNDLEGIVVVEAHKSADFTDQPLAQLRADVSQLADETDISTVNAAFTGIEPGEVFMMAYIDANNNGKRDATESWGYANYVGTERLSIYTPRGVTVTDELYLSSEPPKLVVYIEDVDVNRNEIPDCLETAVAGSAEVQADTDKDGLADADEDGFGTDSSVWDTDGDGMPDGWEALFAELDPNFEDADEVADDDVMAFAVVDAMVVTVQNTANGSDAHHYILKTGAKAPVVGDSADALELFEIYEYPVVVSNEVVNYYGRGAPVALAAEAGTTNRVMGVTSEKVALVHAQVYDEYGFNAKTAVPGDDSVNTKPFTALDKYLVVRYLESIGICGEEAVNVGNLWPQYTLKPFDADFDRDGVADGWELYVMFGPAADKAAAFAAGDVVSPWNFDDRFLSFDEGELALVYEYDGGSAPTDPWNDHTVSTAFTDYGAWRYNLKTPEAQLSDADNDGLSNIQEYRAYADWGLDLDVAEMKTDGETIDYFRIVDIAGNQHYIGEVVADHDFMEDYLEDEHGYDRGLYDATKDSDKDGWSNWAELRSYVESGVEYVADIVSNRVIRTNISVEEYDTIRNNYDVIEDTINFNARYDDAGNLIGSTVTGSIIYWDTQTVMRV